MKNKKRNTGAIFWFLLASILTTFLSVNYAGAAQVAISWTDNSDNETGFVIERRLKSDPVESYLSIGQVGADVRSYVDTTVVVGTLYCFRVKAVNAAGDSAYSNEGCGLAPPSGVTLVYTP